MGVLYRAARPALDLDLRYDVIDDALTFCRAQKLVSKSAPRDRRPTDKELKLLTKWFSSRDGRAQIPMLDIMWFAIHSARRQEEITNLRWDDNNARHHTGVVRDLKDPREKEGNHRTFKYTKEAWEIVKRQPRVSEFIFPYDSHSISAAFARSCKMCGIEGLRFHDFRHEATSRLFEAGYSITEVQQFTLHMAWSTLQRYTHLRAKDVKHKTRAR
jgi:integrase